MGLVVLIVVIIVIVGAVSALFGWDRYRKNPKTAGDKNAQPTDEAFIDPETGRRMRVWYNPSTGQREYRPE